MANLEQLQKAIEVYTTQFRRDDVEKLEHHNWRNEIAEKLMSLQDDDGSWVNPDSPRWWEGNKNLVTAWSVIALNAALQ